MTVQAADRLLKLDSGDAALLYLQLLRRGSLAGLSWPEARLQPALEGLRSQWRSMRDAIASFGVE